MMARQGTAGVGGLILGIRTVTRGGNVSRICGRPGPTEVSAETLTCALKGQESGLRGSHRVSGTGEPQALLGSRCGTQGH